MRTNTRQDEIALWQMYIWSGTRAIEEAPEADGITIVRTAKGKEYRFPLSLDKPFVPQVTATLTEAEDTHILYLIHVWKNHWLDVPSYGLRQALMALHPENKNAHLMLIGEKNFVIRSMEATMPSKAT